MHIFASKKQKYVLAFSVKLHVAEYFSLIKVKRKYSISHNLFFLQPKKIPDGSYQDIIRFALRAGVKKLSRVGNLKQTPKLSRISRVQPVCFQTELNGREFSIKYFHLFVNKLLC